MVSRPVHPRGRFDSSLGEFIRLAVRPARRGTGNASSNPPIDWMNPHVHIHIASAVPGFTEWNIETQGPYNMQRQGLPQSAFKIGDAIQIVLWRAKDGSRQGFTKSITLRDGRTHTFNIAELRCPW